MTGFPDSAELALPNRDSGESRSKSDIFEPLFCGPPKIGWAGEADALPDSRIGDLEDSRRFFIFIYLLTYLRTFSKDIGGGSE